MPETILETFLKISDLHIGDFDVTGSAVVHASWAKCKLFEGFLGHHYRALRALCTFADGLRRRENAQLIVTGDLTSCGSQDQFRDATLYLAAKLPSSSTGLGLQWPAWSTAGISGNHDQWPGTNSVTGAATAGLAATISPAPWIKILPRLATGHFVTFMFVDTDADVGPMSMHRVFARGCFTSQLDELDSILQAPLPQEVRVLVLHHSRSFGPGGPFSRLRITHRSYAALNSFIVDKNIQVLLSGHIHAQYLNLDAVPTHDGSTRQLLECRCGTTTVRNAIPPNWRNLWGAFPAWKLRPNMAIVHRVVRKVDGTVVWRPEEYLLGPYGFAAKPSRAPIELVLL